MTGFASASAELPQGSLQVELRSVNSRFLDVQFRVPDELRALEPALREMIAARIARGKVDCRAQLNAHGSNVSSAGAGALNGAALAGLRRLADEVRVEFPDARPLGVADVLRWPGVMTEDALDVEAMRVATTQAAQRALEDLCASRGREGEKLKDALLERSSRCGAGRKRRCRWCPKR
jgi:uncharacterized protein (TIGR00255 family)